MPLLIGIDLGTSRAKVLVCDERGEILSRASDTSYSTISPRPGWAEQDPECWWHSIKKAVTKAVKDDKVDSAKIVAVGLSGQMHGPVLVDKKGELLRPCIIWSDTRAENECNFIKNEFTDFIEITGNPVVAGFTAPKLLWVKRNQPQIFEKVHKVLLPKDYINFKLTGTFFTDLTDASGTLLFDLNKRIWSKELVDYLDIPLKILPKIRKSTFVTGKVSQKASSEVGLPKGIPVVIGAGDLATSTIGHGLTKSGIAAVTIGTAGQILTPIKVINQDVLSKAFAFSHVIPDMYFLMGTIPAGGLSLQWFKDSVSKIENIIVSDSNIDPYEILTREAETAPVGSKGLFFLPYLMGTGNPHLDYRAKGALIGLTPKHGKPEMIRAIMEGVTYSLKDSFETFKKMGLEFDQIRLGAGGAKSSLWNQIQADIYNKQVFPVKILDASPLGASLLAGVGAGIFDSLEDACELAVKLGRGITPNKRDVHEYEKRYKIYQSLYCDLKDTFLQIEELNNK